MILPDSLAQLLLARHGVRWAEAGSPRGTLAIALDRDGRRHIVIATPAGEADVPLCQPVDPLTGLMPFVGRRLDGALGFPLGDMPAGLYGLALAEDALNVVIDPVLVNEDGEACAGGVRIEVDPMAEFRHPEWAEHQIARAGTPFERALYDAGAIAAEVDAEGTLAGVVSGAGLMMASLDIFTELGTRVRCMVDMQGVPLQGEEGMRRLIEPVARLGPDVIFIGGRFQAPVALGFARAVLAVHAKTPLRGRVFAWIAGNTADEAMALCTDAGFAVFGELRDAIEASAAAVGAG
jgi:succinyl-CoA synthetase beta subunit